MAPDEGLPGDEQPGGAAPDASEGDDPGHFVVFVASDSPSFEKEGTEDDPPLSEEEEREEALQGWLEKAFADGYQQYEKAIVPLLNERDQASYEPATLQERLPRLPLEVTDAQYASDEETIAHEEVVFDWELMVNLLDLYILDGWQPIDRIDEELHAKLKRLAELRGDVPSGGTNIERARELTDLAPWEPAAKLFRLARNAIGQLAREQLASIESLAAIRIQANVAETQTTFDAMAGEAQMEGDRDDVVRGGEAGHTGGGGEEHLPARRQESRLDVRGGAQGGCGSPRSPRQVLRRGARLRVRGSVDGDEAEELGGRRRVREGG